MNRRDALVTLAGVAALTQLFVVTAFANDPVTLPLWPGRAPGETVVLPAEGFQHNPGDKPIAGRPISILGNVSDPTLTIYRPDPAKDTGAAVLVCPGGGYYILAMDLEGTEICAWLNSIGVTGVLLKYRVPRREGRAPHEAPLQDAQRALGLVRSRAQEFGLDPQRIGVLGFSAGGNLSAMLSNHHETRTYPRVDTADDASCRPDFCVLIYPAYLIAPGHSDTLAAEFTPLAASVPPTFLTMTQDDDNGVENVTTYFLALKNARVSAELHVYAHGGHGYGLRRTEDEVTAWPDRVTAWMKSIGVLHEPTNASHPVKSSP